MLRFRDIRDANAAGSYYGKSDGGYYLDGSDLHREVGGKGAERLGLSKTPDFDQFKRLLEGLDPHTGEQLTAKIITGRLAGWDLTASIPKGVTVALERGDSRIHEALWEAGRETMADIEKLITTRVRGGGEVDDRVTGNMIWYGFEHPETRPSREDGMPDPDRHVHFVCANLTFDEVEEKWKAIKFRPIMDLRKYFDRRFDMRLTSKLTELGYEIETEYSHDGHARKYRTWDIKGLPESAIQKFSRRTNEVEELAEKLGVVSPQGKDKLGATSRLHKREDMTLADYRAYWTGRLTADEKREISEVIQDAKSRQFVPDPQPWLEQAVEFSLQHHFERESVCRYTDLAITAMERAMSSGARPEEIDPAMKAQGLLLKNGEATTREVLDEESRMIAFARDGRGTCRPLNTRPENQVEAGVLLEAKRDERPMTPRGDVTVPRRALGSGVVENTATLSPEQQAVCDHVWNSPDRVILIRGGAGTGKTHTMQSAIAGIDKPVVVLAPSAEASRGVLRKEGFKDADTVARFLQDEDFQQKASGGVIWIDEAGLLGVRDMAKVFDVAERLGARIVAQGDSKQHAPVPRGSPFKVLQEFAGLPVSELRDIRRQKGEYKQAVEAIQNGDIAGGFDRLDALGWVKTTEGHEALVNDYMAGLSAGKEQLIVCPTHKEGGEIVNELRERLKQEGLIGKNDRTFETLVPLGVTEAEKKDLVESGADVLLQFNRNSGQYRAGDRIDNVLAEGEALRPDHYTAYARSSLALAAGDTIRITANGRDKSKKHRLNNGSRYKVKGFNRHGDIVLDNGWELEKDFGHLANGLVSTSHSSQGKTVDRVLISMGCESGPAINAQQWYVSVSRARERVSVYSDMSPKDLREAIQKLNPRKSAVELMGTPKPPRLKKNRLAEWVKRVRTIVRQLRQHERCDTHVRDQERERGYER